MAKTIDQLKEQTAQYAIEHITGKGMHTGIALISALNLMIWWIT